MERTNVSSSWSLASRADAPRALALALEDLASDLEETRGSAGAPFTFAVDGAMAPGAFRIAQSHGEVQFLGGDPAGIIRAVYRFAREVLGVDPCRHWTGHRPARRAIRFEGLPMEAPPPRVPIRCYFDNDNDELANLTEPRLQFDWETWKAVVDSLVRLGYNAIDLHDHLGRSEFHRWPFYRALRPDYAPDTALLNRVIDYAHERGVLIQIPMYLQWAFRTIGEDESRCWRTHRKKWLDCWRYYLEHTPIGKGDIFLNRPRDQLWDRPYESACGEDTPTVMTEMFTALRDLILEHNPEAILVCDLYGEGMEIWRTGRFLPPKDYIMVWANDGFGKFASVPGPERRGYRFGAYMHAGYFLNHAVLDPYVDDIERGTRTIFEEERADAYLLVNGQTFRPFILHLEAYACAAEDPGAFSADAFLAMWITRHFGAEAVAPLSAVFRQWHQASGRGFVHAMWRLTSLLDAWESSGRPSAEDASRHEAAALASRLEILPRVRSTLEMLSVAPGHSADFLHDHIALPVGLLETLLRAARHAHDAACAGTVEETVAAIERSRQAFREHLQLRTAGDRDPRWAGWYDPAFRRPNGGFPSLDQYARILDRVAVRGSMRAPLDPEAVTRFVEAHLRPKVRNDGGDITVGSVHEGTVRILADADCATCAATDTCLKWWLERELARLAGEPVRVMIEKRPPYFTRFA